MEDAVTGDFAKQFSGSATANLVFVFALLIYKAFQKCCERESKCHSKIHTCCFEVDIDDRTIRANPLPEGEQRVCPGDEPWRRSRAWPTGIRF